jgi:hypothetical protein
LERFIGDALGDLEFPQVGPVGNVLLNKVDSREQPLVAHQRMSPQGFQHREQIIAHPGAAVDEIVFLKILQNGYAHRA